MMNRSHSFFPLAFVIMSLLVAMLACQFNLDETEKQTTILEQYFLIDPPSLLGSIAQGNKNAFIPVNTEPEFPAPFQQIPVDWTQVDYLYIVQAVFEHVWGEPLNGWHLNNMGFSLSCTNIDIGFQNGDFRFFKNTNTRERESRIMRFINIDPRSKSIHIWESEYYPRLVDWSSIDLAQNRFSADDALNIADSNGGREKRLSVKNMCDISLSLSPDLPRYNGWEVFYATKEDAKFFRIQVDPITGKIHFP
jgi:hypothetical protein